MAHGSSPCKDDRKPAWAYRRSGCNLTPEYQHPHTRPRGDTSSGRNGPYSTDQQMRGLLFLHGIQLTRT